MNKKILFVAACVSVSLVLLNPAFGQETEKPVELRPLSEEVAASFDLALAEIEILKEDIRRIEARFGDLDGLVLEILSARRDRLRTAMYQNTATLARNAVAQRSDGKDISLYYDQLVNYLSGFPDDAYETVRRLQGRVEHPSPDLPPEEFVIADQKLFKYLLEMDDVFRGLNAYVELSAEFGLDASEESEFLVSALTDSAANRSIFMELALDDVAMLKSTVETLPNNTELADWLSAAETRVQLAAASMQDIIALMAALDLNTREYRQQVLTVTGEITTDVLDVGIVTNLLSEWSRAIIDLIAKEGFRILFRLLLVMFILFAFYQFATLVQKLVDRGLDSARVHISHLLRRMIVSTARNLIIIVGILISISQLGISLGPLLAGLGIMGFIIGFALQDTLSNFASGLMILLYRPFDVGDVVEAGGVSGKVSHMSLVNTTFMTFDNQRLVVPNNLIWSSVITNVTAQRTRRVDLTVGISYQDDIEKAESVLRKIISDHESCLDDPEPTVRLHELGESSVNFIVRPWVKTDDYWDTYWDLTRAIKVSFDREGISIPFPQRDVHVIEQKS